MNPGIGLYDSDTGESLAAQKYVRIRGHVWLVYTVATRGRIVQIHDRAVKIHYFFDEASGQNMINEDAWRFDFEDGRELLKLILEHAPGAQ